MTSNKVCVSHLAAVVFDLLWFHMQLYSFGAPLIAARQREREREHFQSCSHTVSFLWVIRLKELLLYRVIRKCCLVLSSYLVKCDQSTTVVLD